MTFNKDKIKSILQNEKLTIEETSELIWFLDSHLYKEKPVCINEFLDNSLFVKDKWPNIFPLWRNTLNEIYPSPFIAPYNEVIISAAAGAGKAQPLSSELLTPQGWIMMKEAQIGQQLFDGKGEICSITGIYPQGIRECYKIKFNDGTCIEVSDEHINSVLINDKEYNIEKVIQNAFQYSLTKVEDMDIGWKYKHVWKPLMNIHIERELNIKQVELFHAKRDLGILIQKLQEILLFVEPSESGLQAYSHKIRELLFLSCSDLESTLKKYQFGKNERMKDYIEILKYVDLTKYKISLVGYANPYKCSPFENWNADKPAKSLSWYEAYNKLKHDREKNFHLATLENCINAIAANLIMFAVRYSAKFLYYDSDAFTNIIRSSLDIRIEYSQDFYIPVLECKQATPEDCVCFSFENGKQATQILGRPTLIPLKKEKKDDNIKSLSI